MQPRDSRSEYEKRMHRVLEHIDQHLDEPLNLEMLAEIAHFSSFHFHRLFSAWMGETLGDYLRRRRLRSPPLRLASASARTRRGAVGGLWFRRGVRARIQEPIRLLAHRLAYAASDAPRE